MSELHADDLYESLQQTVGPPLRGVIRYRGSAIDTALRDDVRESYTSAELRAFVDDNIVHQLSQPEAEGALKLGNIEGVVRIHEQAWVLRVSLGRDLKRGCLVSIDRAGDVSMAVVQECVDAVREHVDA